VGLPQSTLKNKQKFH